SHIALSHYIFFSFFFYCSGPHRHLHSFPTRRSSDLAGDRFDHLRRTDGPGDAPARIPPVLRQPVEDDHRVSVHVLDVVGSAFNGDRKSTRLNSSHVAISYAVFCLKKKKKNTYK